MKRKYFILLIGCLFLLLLSGCGKTGENREASSSKNVVKVYNWGEYIDEDVITQFEEETGIDVIYGTYETNEELYPIIEAGGVAYDAICPSDYMIEKMIHNGLLAKINWENIPNVDQIDPAIMEKSQAFDPQNQYSVPYTYGTLGILYDPARVKEPVDSWLDLWNEAYEDNILMYNSVRDLYVAPLKILGTSINTTDPALLSQATELLKQQKGVVQKYVVDQIKDSMVSGSAYIAMCYSGEVLYIQEERPVLEYVVPKEGSNFFIDSWVIPANAENKENAEAWINFLNRPDIAYKNFEYITYATPNLGAQDFIDEETLKNIAINPTEDILDRCEVFEFLGPEGDKQLNNEWLKVKNYTP